MSRESGPTPQASSKTGTPNGGASIEPVKKDKTAERPVGGKEEVG